MTNDELRYHQCLRKKPMTEAHAKYVAEQTRKNVYGRAKGKKKKRAKTVHAYPCRWSNNEHWHVGHDKFGGKFDPMLSEEIQNIKRAGL